MQAASLLDGFSFDLLPPFENDLAAPELDVSRRHVREPLVVSLVAVVASRFFAAGAVCSCEGGGVAALAVHALVITSYALPVSPRLVAGTAAGDVLSSLVPLAKGVRQLGCT